MKSLKYFILMILVFLSSEALANHHRAHARLFIERAIANINFSLTTFYPYLHTDPGGVFVDPDTSMHYQAMKNHVDLALIELNKALSILSTSTACTVEDVDAMLKGVRRNISQPRLNVTSPDIHSALRRIRGTLYHAGLFLRSASDASEPVDTFMVGRFIGGITVSWNSSDLAEWHIGDAHLEEVDERTENGFGHDPTVDPAGFAQHLIFDPCI